MGAVKAPAARGRPPELDRAQIVDAAHEIIVREGVDALTVRRVARELGTAPMALYRHVADKNALLVLVLDAVYGRLKKPRLPPDPRDRIIALWCFLHDGLARFPWVVERFRCTAIRSRSRSCRRWKRSSPRRSPAGCSSPKRRSCIASSAIHRRRADPRDLRGGRTTPQTSRVLATVSGASPLRLPLLAQAAPHWAAMRTCSLYRDGLTAIVDDALRRAQSG